MPRSLSMFFQSGSISEFRWVSCSSRSVCVAFSCTVTRISAAVHMHTQPFMHNIHYTLKHVPAITHKKICPRDSVLHQLEGKLSQQTPQCLTTQFIDYCHQHIHNPFHPFSTIFPAQSHLTLPQFFKLWPIILCSEETTKKSSVLMVVETYIFAKTWLWRGHKAPPEKSQWLVIIRTSRVKDCTLFLTVQTMCDHKEKVDAQVEGRVEMGDTRCE